jgi:hypothetical protein
MIRHVAIVWVVVASRAEAQPSGAQAEALFREGRELMAAGKTAEACTAFEESEKLDPAVTTLLNLAGCREKLGQLATAWGLFVEAERRTRTATDAASTQLHDVAKAKASKLESRTSKLTIDVPPASRVDGLEITRGKDRIDPGMWNRTLPIDGGTYTISAHVPNGKPWSAQIVIGNEGDTKTVSIPELHADQAAATTTPEEPPHDEVPVRPSNVVPLALGIGGGGLIVGGVVFVLLSRSQYNDAKAETTSQSRRDSLYSSANTKLYIAQGLGVAGVASAGVAVWWYLRHRGDSTATARRDVIVSPAGVAVVGTF